MCYERVVDIGDLTRGEFAEVTQNLDLKALEVWNLAVYALHEHNDLSPRGLASIRKAKPVTLLPELLILAVANESTKVYLEETVKTTLETALSDASKGAVSQFVVTVEPTWDDVVTGSLPVVSKLVEGLDSAELIHSSLNPSYTFDCFITGHSNQNAYNYAKKVAENPANFANPLLIYGDTGLGKTHLLHAIGGYAQHENATVRLRNVIASELVDDWIDSDANSFLGRYQNLDFLLIDNIECLSQDGQWLELFFDIVEYLFPYCQIVFTASLPPGELALLKEIYLSKFSFGLSADIQAPDLETKISILKHIIQTRHLDIADEVLELIAAKVSASVPQLGGALTRVVASASLTGETPNLAQAAEALKDILPVDDKRLY